MPFPAYMKVKDSEGNDIKGSVKIKGREGMIEIQQLSHDLTLPKDPITGKPTGLRRHSPVILIKEFDASSPILYQSCVNGSALKSVEIKWFQINDKGQEQEYYNHLLENCRITSIKAFMYNTKEPEKKDTGHMEEVSISYSKITWTYLDGGITTNDDWEGEH